MHQHSKGITSSKTAAGGLDLLRKDDSNFLHSVDSRQMFKNLYSYQEYFQWSIFLAFICNMRKYIGKKPIHGWLDDNEWTMDFPNWGTYSFLAEINKKSFTSIWFWPISKSLGRSQCYFYWLSQQYYFNPVSEDAISICSQIIPIWRWKSFTYPLTWKTLSTLWTVTNRTVWFNQE